MIANPEFCLLCAFGAMCVALGQLIELLNRASLLGTAGAQFQAGLKAFTFDTAVAIMRRVADPRFWRSGHEWQGESEDRKGRQA